DESQSIVGKDLIKTGARQEVLDVATMARPFADDHLASTGFEKRGGGACDDARVRIDGRARFVLHHVWLQKDAAASNRSPKYLQASVDNIRQIGVVAVSRQNRH